MERECRDKESDCVCRHSRRARLTKYYRKVLNYGGDEVAEQT